LVTQTTAAVGAVAFGILADRIGAKRTITLTLVIWTVLAVSASLVQTHGQFYVIGLLAGAVLGANQTTSRTLLARFTPLGRQAQFFGFFSITGKFAAIIGPVVYGEVTAWTGSQRSAIVSMAVFFLIGLMLIQFVDERRGIATARMEPS
jgi:UMF1 family MFS transporter